MKYIFVTIEEFLLNGGILTKDREIFSTRDIYSTEPDDAVPSQRLAGYYLGYEDGIYLAHNASYKSFPISTILFYVKIEVTPIWK